MPQWKVDVLVFHSLNLSDQFILIPDYFEAGIYEDLPTDRSIRLLMRCNDFAEFLDFVPCIIYKETYKASIINVVNYCLLSDSSICEAC
jgi:hypothetical protein